jgi:hypothetical protein
MKVSLPLPAAGPEPNMVQGRQVRTMEMNNPPFSKGGLGGFESYFLCNWKMGGIR